MHGQIILGLFVILFNANPMAHSQKKEVLKL
jgi:hypothetical protein